MEQLSFQQQQEVPTEQQTNSYLPYDSLQPIDSSIDIMQLLEWIKNNLDEKKQWVNTLNALNALRTLNKFNNSYMNDICRLIWPSLNACLSSVKTTISKTSMMFLQELFFHSKTNLLDDIILQVEPVLVQKSFSDKGLIKVEAQKGYQLMIENCLKDSTIIAISKSCMNKNFQISELSFKALERMVSLIGQNVTNIQAPTFKDMFVVIKYGLSGKRSEIQKSSENLVKYLYQFLGDANFGQLITLLINNSVLANEDIERLKKVFEQKESKPKENFIDKVKSQRPFKESERYSNQINPSCQNTYNTQIKNTTPQYPNQYNPYPNNYQNQGQYYN